MNPEVFMPVYCPDTENVLNQRTLPMDLNSASWLDYLRATATPRMVNGRGQPAFDNLLRGARDQLAVRGITLGDKLGCGDFGCVYALSEDTVLKITGDPSDAMAMALLARTDGPLPTALPRVRCAFAFTAEFPRLYGVILERCRPYATGRTTRAFLDETVRTAIWRYGRGKYTRADLDILTEEAANQCGDAFVANVLDPLLRATAWLKKRGLAIVDTHAGNVMMRTSGEVVISDLGGLHAKAATLPIPLLAELPEDTLTLTEFCPCEDTADPTAWMRDDHAEIRGLIRDATAAFDTHDPATIRSRLTSLLNELTTHFHEEETRAFARLRAQHNLPHTATSALQAEHAPLLRSVRALLDNPNRDAFLRVVRTLEDHAQREDRLFSIPAVPPATSTHAMWATDDAHPNPIGPEPVEYMTASDLSASRARVGASIRNKMHEGIPQRQAVAMSLDMELRHRLRDDGTYIRTERQASTDIPQDIVDLYSAGRCIPLTYVLHQRYGWPMFAEWEMDHPPAYIAHMHVRAPNGQEVDILGPQARVDRFTAHGHVEPITAREIRALYEDLEDFADALANAEPIVDQYVVPALRRAGLLGPPVEYLRSGGT